MPIIDYNYLQDMLPDIPVGLWKTLSDHSMNTYGVCAEIDKAFGDTRYRNDMRVTVDKQPRKRNFPTGHLQLNTRWLANKLHDATGINLNIRFTDYDIENESDYWAQSITTHLNIRIERVDDKNKIQPPDDETAKRYTKYLLTKTKIPCTIYRTYHTNADKMIWNIKTTKVTPELMDALAELLIPMLNNTVIDDKLFDILTDIIQSKPEYKNKLITYLKEKNNPANAIQIALKKQTNHRIESLKREIEHKQRYLDRAIENVMEYRDAIQRLQDELTGAELTAEKSMDLTKYQEVIEYLEQCFPESTAQLTVENDQLAYYVQGTSLLQMFSEEAANSLYNAAIDDKRYSDTQLAYFKAQFIDQTIATRVSFNFMFYAMTYNASTPHSDYMPANAYPHPHLTRYNCWGNHTAALRTYQAQEDLIGALSQCMYATSQINVLDACVLRNLMSDVPYLDNVACIYDKETEKYTTWPEYYKEHYVMTAEVIDEDAVTAYLEADEDIIATELQATLQTAVEEELALEF